MDPLNPWLDADEVRRMALRLIQPVKETSTNLANAGFGETFIGFTSPDASPSPRPSGSSSHAAANWNGSPIPAAPPGAVGAPEASMPEMRTHPALGSKSQAAPESSARGPFLDRIRQLRDWLERQFSASGVFILDREGAVIFDESDLGRLHFLARSLALASRRPGTAAANVHVKIGAGTTLEVIPVETPYGCIVLGAVVPEALKPASVSAVMEALAKVATPPA